MGPSTMELFAKNGFQPIELDGLVVHPMFRSDLAVDDQVRVSWVSAASVRTQGIALRLRVPGIVGQRGEGGVLRAGGVEAPTIVLWMDTSPPVVDIDCVETAFGAELQISNRWRAASGREDEWLNNFGMLIEPADQGCVTLRCSDGHGDRLTFDDLIVRIDILRRE